MTISLEMLRAKVEPLYPEVEQISDTVLRCIRKTAVSPFAVYYLDVGEDLPQTLDILNDYLNRVLAKSYFEGSSSLQWNNYLYFIRSSDRLQDAASQKAKELVEQDRVYARKFVIVESELDSVLRPKTQTAAGVHPVVDTISPWISILQEAHLVEAILGEHSLPERMKLIENPPAITFSSPFSAKPSSDTLLPPIRQFEFKEFERKYPRQNEFHFGTVNLLFGANGTGKTSLLEAIELFYCGKTRRNPKVSEHYIFNALENGKYKSVNNNRKPQTLRDRNLEWYGVREEKSTKLYDGFGRFNFLNTDAAIELSQSTENINDDLAKLLVGSEAAKTWQVIEKMAEKIRMELDGAKKLQLQVLLSLNMLTKKLSEISAVKKESDSLCIALHETLRRNQWMINDVSDSEIIKFISELAKLKATSEQVGDLYWLDAPVTLRIIESYSKAADSIIQQCSPSVEILKTLSLNQRQLSDAVLRDQVALPLLGELERLIKSEIEKRTIELEKHREIIVKCSILFAGVDEETFRIFDVADGNLAVGDYRDLAVADRKRKEDGFLTAKREHGDFVKLRDHSLSLAEELRGIATRIIEEKPSDECPLCHTKFKHGELAHRITEDIDGHLETKVQKLLDNVRCAEEALVIAVASEKGANQLSSLCAGMQLSSETLLKDAVASLGKTKDAQAVAQKRADILASEIRAMEAQGLTLLRLNEVTARLNEIGIHLTDKQKVKASMFKSDIEERLASSRSQIEENFKEVEKLKAFLRKALSVVGISDDDPTSAIAKLNERFVANRTICSALKRFLPRFSWKETRPIVEWMVEAEEVRGIAIQLQTAYEKERIAAKSQSDDNRLRDELTGKNKTLTDRIKRLKVVKEALADIQTKHSLEVLTESALEAHRESIEKIFSQIHAPAEFKGIGKNWALIRKLDNTKMPLTMISTGQRAAFALAVFLAQNAQLKSGPQVILIDDPIAHVDDLNCFSFLDYLREIALTETRQIFFATANTKLASLFERKFDFLGDKFQRINLTR